MKDEAPAFLTVTSLELPDSPIPLIDSQAIARSRSRESASSHEGKDDVMDELIGKVVSVRTRTGGRKSKRNKSIGTVCTSDASLPGSSKCERRDSSNLEEHTRRIIEGPSRFYSILYLLLYPRMSHAILFFNFIFLFLLFPGVNFSRRRASSSSKEEAIREQDCICSEVSESLRINIRKKTESKRRLSRSQSPEVTHLIRIAMKYHGQEECKEEIPEGENSVSAKTARQDDGCCPGVSVALDFTLNCSSLHLTSRDVSVKPNKDKAALTHLDQRIEDGA